MHIYVLHNTSTKLSGKHSTAKEKAKVDPERENLVESKLNIGVRTFRKSYLNENNLALTANNEEPSNLRVPGEISNDTQ